MFYSVKVCYLVVGELGVGIAYAPSFVVVMKVGSEIMCS